MNVSRAGFLKICVAALLGRSADASSMGASISDAAAAALGGSGSRFNLDHATAALFQSHVNTTFAVRSADGTPLPLVLARVTERPLIPGVDQFSVSFHAAPGLPVSHGTHAFQHATLGGFDLFVSPVGGGTAEYTEYEACFSRYHSDQDCAARATVGDDVAC